MTHLAELVHAAHAGIEVVAEHLERLSFADRLKATRSLGRSEQRLLYEKAAASSPLSVSDLVPANHLPLVPVHHHGTNTLPLPAPLRAFEKRLCRSADGPAVLYGYNHGATMKLLGPGYFVAYATKGRPAWESRGPWVIDYFRVPEGPVPEGWPTVVPNHRGPQRFVYDRTRDYLRRVADGVTIGAAYREERPLDHYFVLCREG